MATWGFRAIRLMKVIRTMWLEKFLDLISKVVPIDPVAGLEKELSHLNPDKIYLENVRSILHVSAQTAFDVLETAVRQGFMRKGIEVRCPDGYVAVTADVDQQLPKSVRCWQEENGETLQVEMPTDKLEHVTFYKLNDKSRAAVLHG